MAKREEDGVHARKDRYLVQVSLSSARVRGRLCNVHAMALVAVGFTRGD